MKLLDEIISSLSSEKESLTEALLKTKILLHQIGHKELVEWVNFEINGYPGKMDVPEYRIVHGMVVGNLLNGFVPFNSHPIPIGHLSDKIKKQLTVISMRFPLTTLDVFVKKNGDFLRNPIPLEANGELGRTLTSGCHIQEAWTQISVADINTIFIQVRSRLLDFVLGLKDYSKEDMSESEFNEQVKAVAPSIFRTAINGQQIQAENVVFNIGNGNQQSQTSVKINVTGDIALLEKKLAEKDVAQVDLDRMKEAISLDAAAPELIEKKFGPAVTDWMRSMYTKVVDTSWNIEMSIAANLMTDALKHYYGWF